MAEHLTKRQVDAFHRQEMLGEELYKKYLLALEECNRFRKEFARTLRGKPTPLQRLDLLINDSNIAFYKSHLYGEPYDGMWDKFLALFEEIKPTPPTPTAQFTPA